MHDGEILGMCMHSGRASNRRHLGGVREGMRPGVVRRRRIEAWSTTGWRRNELKSKLCRGFVCLRYAYQISVKILCTRHPKIAEL